MNLYVGNLSRDAVEDDVRRAFEAYGKVVSINIIRDKFSGESRGFCFVDMPVKAEANAAMDALNGQEINGRALIINEARPRNDDTRGRNKRGGGRRF